MCCSSKSCNSNKSKVYSVHNSNGEINSDEENDHHVELPKHVDDPFLNRNVKRGTLGFRYETKNEMLLVYSSLEAKTFCILMSLSPLRRQRY